MSSPDPTFDRWDDFEARRDRGWRTSGGFDLEQHWVTAQRRSLRPPHPTVGISVNHPDPVVCADAALEAMDRIDGVTP